MNKIKVLIVDDEKLITEGLKIMLSIFDDLDIVGVASNGYKALEICKKEEINVVLMDIRMDKCDGVLGTRLIKESCPNTKVLILTTFNDEEYIHEALKYGASGYLLKDSSHEVIYSGLKSAFMGNVVVHPEVATKIVSHHSGDHQCDLNKITNEYRLTPKEITIIKEISNGLTNKEIGEKLFLSEGTIKNNISSILLKLNLRDRTQIAIFAFKNNLAQ